MIGPTAGPTLFSLDFEKRGRKAATTFRGFCTFHDNALFKPIEESPYSGDSQQNFLMAYRAFCLEYFKKLRTRNLLINTIENKPDVSYRTYFIEVVIGTAISLSEFEADLIIFNNSIVNKMYTTIRSAYCYLDEEIKIAACSTLALEYDLNGNKLQALSDSSPLKKLFLNIFPQNNRTHIIFSWLMSSDHTYLPFKKQIENLTREQIIYLINNILPTYIENVTINPKLWAKLPDSYRKNYMSRFVTGILSVNDEARKNLLKKPNYDICNLL